MFGTKIHPTVIWKVAAVILAMTLVMTPVNPAGANDETYAGAPISLELVDADLYNVLSVFSKATDYIFAVDAQSAEMGGLDSLVSADYESVPWDRAMDEILTGAGFEWTLEGKVLWIHLPAHSPTGDRNFTGDAINLRLEDARLVDVLETMSKVSGVKINYDPNLDVTVSVKLRSVPWDQALDLILRISGFGYAQESGALNVFQVSEGKGMQLIETSDI